MSRDNRFLQHLQIIRNAPLEERPGLLRDVARLLELNGGRTNRSRSIKRKRRRRTNSEMLRLKADALDVCIELAPVTCRQTFYQLVSRGAIEKTEAEYKAVVRVLTELRRQCILPFRLVADNTRWMRKPRTYSGLEAYLEYGAEAYRRAMWENQDVDVEIWLEKDALAGVLLDVTAGFDVPLMVTRGYPSLSFLHSAAEQIDASEKPTYLYYFGDHDPSGADISRNVEEQIGDMLSDPDLLSFERIAVNPNQIIELGLPTRPTKSTDSRSKNFEGESVEVDAIHPNTLREMARECVVQHIDEDEWNALLRTEDAERESLAAFASTLNEESGQWG